MQFLTALLAFAAVMALLSTIIAVAIEAFIGTRGMRRRGLERLLAGYYRTAVVPRLPPSARPSDAEINRVAAQFASAMTVNPARLGRSGRGGGAAFQHLTTRQLIEQLARTPAGEALLALDDNALRPRLEALAYEFDRYSEGARTFFTRRTRIASVILAILFAFSLNVDALRLYKVLSTDASTREAIIRWADARIASDDIDGPRIPAPDRLTPADGTEAEADVAQQELNNLVALLGTMSIPVGYSQYPFCLAYSPLHGIVAEGDVVFDPRCGQVKQRIGLMESLDSAPQGGAVELARERGSEQPALVIKAGAAGNAMFSVLPPIYRARVHFDTWVWFFSVLVAGGMVGLGAPFWFNVYRRIAMLIPAVGAASAVAAQLRIQPTQGGESAPTNTTPGRRDDANVRGSDNLVVVARTAGGGSPDVAPPVAPVVEDVAPNLTGASPQGGAIGAGSAQRVAAASAAANAGPGATSGAGAGGSFQLSRRLRG